MIENIEIGNCVFKVEFSNDLEKIIIMRDSIIALGLHQNHLSARIQMEKCCKELIILLQNNRLDISFGYGYTSILYMDKFLPDHYLKQHVDEYLKLTESIIEIFAKKNEFLIIDEKFNQLFDYFKGITGVYNYYLQFSNDKKIHQLIINTLVNCIKATKFEKYMEINLSIAHGLSSIILILSNYMGQHKLKLDQEEQISKLHDYVLNKLMHLCIKKHELSVAWGNGELGILYSLVIFNNNRRVKKNISEYLEILKLILNKAHQRSIEKNNICYGGVGTKFMLNKLRKYNEEMRIEIDKYICKYLNSKYKGHVLHSTEVKMLSVGEYSIINGALAEHILTSSEVNDRLMIEYFKYFML